MQIKILSSKNEVMAEMEVYHFVYLALFKGEMLTVKPNFLIEIDGSLIHRPEGFDNDE